MKEKGMSDIKWTDVIQSIGVIAALLFTGWEMHRRTREQRFQNYLASISGFADLARLMVEKPELHSLYEYSTVDLTKTYEQLSSDERAKVHYCDAVIALCETVWLAGEQGWLSKDEWPFWKQWANDLGGSPYFRWTAKWVAGEYDATFLAALMASQQKKSATAA